MQVLIETSPADASAGRPRAYDRPHPELLERPHTHTCYCGCKVIGSSICPDCARGMVARFLAAAEARGED
jgi:hypothetical protein